MNHNTDILNTYETYDSVCMSHLLLFSVDKQMCKTTFPSFGDYRNSRSLHLSAPSTHANELKLKNFEELIKDPEYINILFGDPRSISIFFMTSASMLCQDFSKEDFETLYRQASEQCKKYGNTIQDCVPLSDYSVTNNSTDFARYGYRYTTKGGLCSDPCGYFHLLIDTCTRYDVDTYLSFLLDKGADIRLHLLPLFQSDPSVIHAYSPLHLAIIHNSPRCLKVLIQKLKELGVYEAEIGQYFTSELGSLPYGLIFSLFYEDRVEIANIIIDNGCFVVDQDGILSTVFRSVALGFVSPGYFNTFISRLLCNNSFSITTQRIEDCKKRALLLSDLPSTAKGNVDELVHQIEGMCKKCKNMNAPHNPENTGNAYSYCTSTSSNASGITSESVNQSSENTSGASSETIRPSPQLSGARVTSGRRKVATVHVNEYQLSVYDYNKS